MSRRPLRASSYLFTYLALVALAVLSLLLSRLELRGGLVVALFIALGKALLVLWFFMHLRGQRVTSALAMLLAGLWILLLAGGAAVDVVSRRDPAARVRPATDEGYYRR